MRVLAALLLCACGRPEIDDRDVSCPEMRCPPDFTCGWDGWCYRQGRAPANFAGSYMLTTTTGENGCNIMDWVVGSVAMAPMTVTQDGTTVQATIDGFPGLILSLALGSNMLAGSVDGNTVHMSFNGPNAIQNAAMCMFRVSGTGDAFLQGDTIDGELDFAAVMPSCPELEGCHNPIFFEGDRAPSSAP